MSNASDAGDPAAVEAHLLAALEPSLGPVTMARPPEQAKGATSTWVWFVELAGVGLAPEWRRPLVARIFRPGEEAVAERDEALSAYLHRHGYPAPRTLARVALDGDSAACLVQERLPGRPAIEVLAGPRLRPVVRGLARLQAHLHLLPADDCPLPTVDAATYLRDDLDRRRARTTEPDPDGTLDWLHATAASVEVPVAELAVCHNDFHPLNALVDADGSIGVIDWTDARVSDPHGDVGRTMAIFWFASLVAGSAVERAALRLLRGWLARTHRRTYEQARAVRLDDRRLLWWQLVHVHRSWLQLAELEEGAVIGPESTTRAALPDDLPDRLVARAAVLRAEVEAFSS